MPGRATRSFVGAARRSFTEVVISGRPKG